MQAVVLGGAVLRGKPDDVVRRHSEERATATFPVEVVTCGETRGCGVCVTDRYGEIAGVVDEPDEPASNPATTGTSTIDAIRVDGWRVAVGYPENRERAELRGGAGAPPPATAA